jgi:pimeloyl-ACP methyl ester carboxylesterase
LQRRALIITAPQMITPYDGVVSEINLITADGRTLHAYSIGEGPHVIMWHHGTPNIGTPPAPLYRAGIRFIGYDRPGYGGSTARPGRTIATAAEDAAAVADALNIGRFAVMGHSGGGPHALACAALLQDRITTAVSISGLAPKNQENTDDWFTGMGPSSEASLRAATKGRAAKEEHEKHEADPDFIEADWTALNGTWGWFGSVVAPAMANGPAPLIDDDLAYVNPWGFDPRTIRTPTLLIHGTADRMVPARHSEWLAQQIPNAELGLEDGQGHISVLEAAAEDALYFSSSGS